MGWDDERGRTFVQRTKETANDYRYFPEPDLPPLTLDPDWVDEIAGIAARAARCQGGPLRQAELGLDPPRCVASW